MRKTKAVLFYGPFGKKKKCFLFGKKKGFLFLERKLGKFFFLVLDIAKTGRERRDEHGTVPCYGCEGGPEGGPTPTGRRRE